MNARQLAPLALGIAALATIVGCIERKETVSVEPDGSVTFTLNIEGDASDFNGGDALPAATAGWETRRKTETNDEGRERTTLHARMAVAPGEALPDSFAAPDEPLYDTALRFPTDVTIEERPDGTYYHFQRVYRARERARYSYHEEVVRQQANLPEDGPDWEEMSAEQQRNLLRALQQIEARKHVEYVQAGAAALTGRAQDVELQLRRVLLDRYEAADLEGIADLLQQPQSAERDAAIASFADDLVSDAEAALQQRMVRLGLARREIDAFFAAYEQERQRHEITQDLSDERWEVTVELPGDVVAHNGSLDEKGNVTWDFDSDAIMDRDHVLMATSRVR